MLNKNDIIIILILLGLLDFRKKMRSLCTIQGKYREMDASGRVFVPLCFPRMSAGHVLSSLLWRPDLQMSRGFWQKSSVFFIFFHCPKFPVGNWCHSQGKPNIWKFHILQTGNTRGTKGHPPGWGESQSYNPHFLTSEAVLNPLKPSCPSLCALYFLYSFHGFQEDLKPCGHGFHSVCSAGWLAGPLKPQALL